MIRHNVQATNVKGSENMRYLFQLINYNKISFLHLMALKAECNAALNFQKNSNERILLFFSVSRNAIFGVFPTVT